MGRPRGSKNRKVKAGLSKDTTWIYCISCNQSYQQQHQEHEHGRAVSDSGHADTSAVKPNTRSRRITERVHGGFTANISTQDAQFEPADNEWNEGVVEEGISDDRTMNSGSEHDLCSDSQFVKVEPDSDDEDAHAAVDDFNDFNPCDSTHADASSVSEYYGRDKDRDGHVVSEKIETIRPSKARTRKSRPPGKLSEAERRRRARFRAQETKEQRATRLARDRESLRRAKLKETPEARAARLAKIKEFKLAKKQRVQSENSSSTSTPKISLYISKDMDTLYYDVVYHGELTSYECKVCWSLFEDLLGLKIHQYQTQHNKPGPESTTELDRLSTTNGPCPAPTNEQRSPLEPFVDDSPFPCRYCGRNYSTRTKVNYHIRNIHLPQPTVCDICAKTFRSAILLRQHQSRVHETCRDFLCSACGKGFATNSLLLRHLKLGHTNSDRSRSRALSQTLRASLPQPIPLESNTGTKSKLVQCPLCNRKIAAKNYAKHLGNAHGFGGQDWGCSKCDAVFKVKEMWKRHEALVDEGAAPRFQCTECTKKYCNLRALDKHQHEIHDRWGKRTKTKVC